MTIEKFENLSAAGREYDHITDEGLCDFIDEHAAKCNTLRILDISKVSVSFSVTDRVSAKSLAALSKLTNLREVRVNLDHFADSDIAMAWGVGEGARSVRRLFVLRESSPIWKFDRKEMTEFWKSVGRNILTLFPGLTELSYQDLSDECSFNLVQLRDNAPDLIPLLTSVSVQGLSNGLIDNMSNLEQIHVHGLGRRIYYFPTLSNLKRLVLEKDYFELPFSIVLDVLNNCTSLRELLVHASKITGATDEALATVFRDRAHLHQMEIFYLASPDVPLALTGKSVDLITRTCAKSLKRLGQLQTWTIPADMSDSSVGPEFKIQRSARTTKYFKWCTEKPGVEELDHCSKFFYC